MRIMLLGVMWKMLSALMVTMSKSKKVVLSGHGEGGQTKSTPTHSQPLAAKARDHPQRPQKRSSILTYWPPMCAVLTRVSLSFSALPLIPENIVSRVPRTAADFGMDLEHCGIDTRLLPVGIRLLPVGTRLLPAGIRLLPVGIRLLPVGTRLPPVGTRLLPVGIRLPPVERSQPSQAFGLLALRLIRQDESDAVFDWLSEDFQPSFVMDVLNHVAYLGIFAGFAAFGRCLLNRSHLAPLPGSRPELKPLQDSTMAVTRRPQLPLFIAFKRYVTHHCHGVFS